MIDKHFIFITEDGKVKINPLGKRGDVCNICENNSSSCPYCFSFDMFWYKDQETSDLVYDEMNKK